MANNSVTITKVFSVSPDKVWAAWTDPKQLAQWWAPDGFSVPTRELDVTVGGQLRIDMQGPDGTIYPSVGEYKQVEKPAVLSFSNTPLDAEGNELFTLLQTARF